MNLTLKIWRQKGPSVKGKLVTYQVSDISPDMSFLEMLDVLNEKLILDGEALRHDDDFSYVAAWEFGAEGRPTLHKEDLNFEYVHPSTRSYK